MLRSITIIKNFYFVDPVNITWDQSNNNDVSANSDAKRTSLDSPINYSNSSPGSISDQNHSHESIHVSEEYESIFVPFPDFPMQLQ